MFNVSGWDRSLEPLRLEGQGTYTIDRITLEATDRSPAFLDGVAITLASNLTIMYPEKTYYTMDTGLVSVQILIKTFAMLILI